MATKIAPGPHDSYRRALPDEPLFVLLARDPSAPGLVRTWAEQRSLAIARGERPAADQAKVVEALECATRMSAWRRANLGVWSNQRPAAAPPPPPPEAAQLREVFTPLLLAAYADGVDADDVLWSMSDRQGSVSRITAATVRGLLRNLPLQPKPKRQLRVRFGETIPRARRRELRDFARHAVGLQPSSEEGLALLVDPAELLKLVEAADLLFEQALVDEAPPDEAPPTDSGSAPDEDHVSQHWRAATADHPTAMSERLGAGAPAEPAPEVPPTDLPAPPPPPGA